MAWKQLFSKSAYDFGTLAFFRNRLRRVAVSKEPKKAVDATIEFLDTVVKGHWLGCACELLGITSLDDPLTLPSHVKKGRPKDQLLYVQGIARQIVERLTLVDGAFLASINDDEVDEVNEVDKVYNYTRVLCHYGAIVTEFRDAWAEGDGDRVVRCWKMFMLHFKASGCTKYALEALRLQIQLKTASPNLAHQIRWHRFVNTHGGLGRNIPCDLYNEHLNKLVKRIIQNMGPNLTEDSLKRAVRCVSPLHDICKNFDAATNVPGAHTTKSDLVDIEKVVSVVLQEKLLIEQVTPRNHQCYPNISINPLNKLNRKKVKAWINSKKAEYRKHKGGFKETEPYAQPDVNHDAVDVDDFSDCDTE